MLRHEEFHQSPMEFKSVSWNMMAWAEKMEVKSLLYLGKILHFTIFLKRHALLCWWPPFYNLFLLCLH